LLSAEQLGAAPGPEEPVRLGVVGWPVAHSRSPAIHNAALAATGAIGWRYQLLPIPPELFAETVPALAGAGFRGVNVTIPHKAAALSLATEASSRATAIGAANTLVFGPGGRIAADNTDAPALVDALPRPMRGATALILGAGGSARAALWALIDGGAAAVWVWNRTPERAEALCAELGGEPILAPVPANVLVNCTAVGLDGSGALDGLPIGPEQLSDYGYVIDLVYASAPTGLIAVARQAGIPTVDGLELLVGQGALSFELFTGHVAPREVMRAAAENTPTTERAWTGKPTQRADP
jgi:shikimate dehydrogenase